MRFIDRMARIYETRLWYPIVLNIYGGFHSPSLAQLVSTVTQKVQSTKGRVLDIACGPGTFGRQIASPSTEVFGIDVSMGMLRQGMAYIAKEANSHMYFARARVEALPFQDGLFDAVLCCGSLHLFADTVIALREMVMRNTSDKYSNIAYLDNRILSPCNAHSRIPQTPAVARSIRSHVRDAMTTADRCVGVPTLVPTAFAE